MRRKRGKFILIEGPDLSGKSTIGKRLTITMKSFGVNAHYNQMKNNFWGQFINKIGKKSFVPTIIKDLLFLGGYLYDTHCIKKRLRHGQSVIQDRYYSSLLTYHQIIGPLRNKTRITILPLVKNLEKYFLIPDIVFYVYTPLEVRLARFKRQPRKGINDSILYGFGNNKRIAIKYNKALQENLKIYKNIIKIDNSGSLNYLEEKLLNIIRTNNFFSDLTDSPVLDLRKKAIEVSHKLIGKYPFSKGIFVFGSVARGIASRNSDIDICVIGKRKGRKILKAGDTKAEIYFTNLKQIKYQLKEGFPDTIRRLRNAWIVFDPNHDLQKLKKVAQNLNLALSKGEKLEIVGDEHDLLTRAQEDIHEFLDRGDLESAIYKARSLFERILEIICRDDNEDWFVSPKYKICHVRELKNRDFANLYMKIMFKKLTPDDLEMIIRKLIEIKGKLFH